MSWKCVACVILTRIYLTSAEYNCHTIENNVTCTSLQGSDLYENLTVTLTKEEYNEIMELRIVDSFIFTIKKNMFDNFQNIQILRLQNTSTKSVTERAFEDLLSLNKVFLTDNYLEEFNSNAFAINNSIHTLDLSHNLLNHLDNFDITLFPSLIIMNISHNRLEYLPESMLNKVKERNNFYLIVENNPWNCFHPNWTLHLTELLVKAFCEEKLYDSSEIELKIEKLAALENSENTDDSGIINFDCMKYSLKSCIFWALGAVWIGIIIGNMCKLKRLLFTEPVRYEDKMTQCEFPWREPFIREEYSKADTQNIKSPSKPNIK